jgi:hypothetical protein
MMPIISLHVPKAAGTSLRKYLNDLFGGNLFLHYRKNSIKGGDVFWTPPERIDMNTINKNVHTCVHGHFRQSDGTSSDKYYPEINRFILLLRDPLSIQISNYFYLKMQEKRDNGKRLKVNNVNEYLEKSKSFIFDNLPAEARKDYKNFIQEKCLVVGVTEKFNDYITGLYYLYDRKLPLLNQKRENISNWDESLDQDVIDSWKERHQKEYGLYDFISKLSSGGFNKEQKSKLLC